MDTNTYISVGIDANTGIGAGIAAGICAGIGASISTCIGADVSRSTGFCVDTSIIPGTNVSRNTSISLGTFFAWGAVGKVIVHEIVGELKGLCNWNSYERVELEEKKGIGELGIETPLVDLSS